MCVQQLTCVKCVMLSVNLSIMSSLVDELRSSPSRLFDQRAPSSHCHLPLELLVHTSAACGLDKIILIIESDAKQLSGMSRNLNEKCEQSIFIIHHLPVFSLIHNLSFSKVHLCCRLLNMYDYSTCVLPLCGGALCLSRCCATFIVFLLLWV